MAVWHSTLYNAIYVNTLPVYDGIALYIYIINTLPVYGVDGIALYIQTISTLPVYGVDGEHSVPAYVAVPMLQTRPDGRHQWLHQLWLL